MGLKDVFNNNAKSMTALDKAIERGHKDVAEFLIKQGAALNEQRAKARVQQKTAQDQKAAQTPKTIKVMKPLKLKRPKGRGGNSR